ncbi:MAG: AAA family ATPase [Acidobacteria bacterium]|nr:AAA family ATPase [Acidobacteriota bacterium]
MLRVLRAENLALIESVTVEFKSGFVCITGETGAGKSLLLDALQLLSGARAASDLVRTGCDKAVVEAEFECDVQADLDLLEGPQLFLRREVTSEGRSRAFVNGVAVPNSVLAQYAEIAFELYGQGGQHQLLSSSHHLPLFDRSMALQEQSEEFVLQRKHFEAQFASYWAIVDGEQERLRAIDSLSMQIAEIEKVGPNEEDLDIEIRLKRLRHAEDLRAATHDLGACLDDRVLPDLGRVSKNLDFILGYHPHMEPYREQVQTARDTLRELQRDLNELSVSDNPKQTAELESRVHALNQLMMKYGRDVEEVMAEWAAIKHKRETLLSQSAELPDAWRNLQAAYGALTQSRKELDQERLKSCEAFAKRVNEALIHLSFKDASFEPRYHWSQWPAELPEERILGLPNAEMQFFLAANLGETAKPLAKIASGGEISRVLLAVICSFERSAPITMVFDEVDAGIGGATANHVGIKLAELGARHQVICVTHLAQVASKANQHLTIEKVIDGTRTRTSIYEVSGEQRVSELARLMGGDSGSASLKAHAMGMLDN